MDFFQSQDQARRRTKWLVLYFVLAVALMILAVYGAALVIFTGAQARSHHRFSQAPVPIDLWNPELFGGVAMITLAVVFIGSASKTAALAEGGSAVAEMFGGRLIDGGSQNADERKLLNIVEEMSIASGVPMPRVFILDNEPGINAFAAGHAMTDAAVTVTRGAIQRLTRDELQGVIGHEFSHILNGDMRLNLRLMGIIFGIICLTVIGRVLLYTGRGGGRREERNALPLFGLALMVVGAAGAFFGRLIQAAVSRQREFLADASSAQFTRNPAGLAGALKKIGGLEEGSRIHSPRAAEVSHMFFGNGLGEPFFGLLATHPPLEERIRALDPAFDGHFTVSEEEPEAAGPIIASGFHGGSPSRRPSAAIPTRAALPTLGRPGAAHLAYAEDVRRSFPPALREAARDPVGATAIIYGLLLSAEESSRASQLDHLKEAAPEAVYAETVRLWPTVAEIAARGKLALANLALPGLRQLSGTQAQQFKSTLAFLIASDGQIDLFEFVLQKMAQRHLDPPRRVPVQYYSLKPLNPDFALLLSAMAYAGQEDERAAVAAFQSCQTMAAAYPPLSLLPASACGLAQVDNALNRLAQASPQIKKTLLQACAEVASADGVIQELEAELLRGIADTLDCPIPPFLDLNDAPSSPVT